MFPFLRDVKLDIRLFNNVRPRDLPLLNDVLEPDPCNLAVPDAEKRCDLERVYLRPKIERIGSITNVK